MKLIFSTFVVLLFTYSDAFSASYTIRLTGRSDVTVTTPVIFLGDIGQFSGDNPLDEAIIALKKIEIQKAPAPGQSVTLSADQILAKMSDAGVDLKHVGYSLPRTITVKQASRTFSTDEAKALIEGHFAARGEQIAVKDITFPETQAIFPGAVKISVSEASPASRGKIKTTFTVRSTEGSEMKVPAFVRIDEFREVAVASRTVPRGSLIEAGDVTMARLNVSELPDGAAEEQKQIIGLEANKSIRAGEPLYSGNLKIPPLVTSGSTVTIQYKSKYLEATTTGTALDTGILGSEIRVRNEQSKKILKGKILESGLVGVIQ